MNPSKNRYTIKFEPGGQNYTIYNNNVAAYTGYDTFAEAEADLEKIMAKEQGKSEVATAKDFEEFFRMTYDGINPDSV
jgi:hypothetical protein